MTSLAHTSALDIATLGLLQRILVTTDGTLTDMLAAAFLEPIQLVKLVVTIERSREPVRSLDVVAGSTIMRRSVVLRGERSLVNYVYAETLIDADRLTPQFRDDLLAGNVPLGQLWLTHRLETWKERPRVRRRPAGELAGHLGVSEDAGLIERNYRTFTAGAPVFDVTEFFPLEYPARKTSLAPQGGA
jgi:chorismate-pyruvate lyase